MSLDHKAIDWNARLSDLISTGESDLMVASGFRFDEMELTLGLPGGSRERKSRIKRKFSDMFDLELSVNSSNYRERRVIGWPPVRKNTMDTKNKYVKVAVDGAPYLRKVDLTSYTGYRQLLSVLDDIMSSFNNQNVLIEKKLRDSVISRWEHVPTYEDKDGDWMLLGDVPWKMFVETCKRIRLTRSSEAINQLGVHHVCSSTSFKRLQTLIQYAEINLLNRSLTANRNATPRSLFHMCNLELVKRSWYDERQPMCLGVEVDKTKILHTNCELGIDMVLV